MKEKDINSLEHTKWRCQYHIVFAPKYRRQAIYKEIKTDIGKILRKLCERLFAKSRLYGQHDSHVYKRSMQVLWRATKAYRQADKAYFAVHEGQNPI